jgi:hypothetical protein
MRQSGKNTRQRGRGGRRSNNYGQINRNTTLDSNGPDVRLRGNAQQLHEKYTSLGNEAAAAGERIPAEAYYQYADHYFRVHSTIMANLEDRRPPQQNDSSAAADDHPDHGSGNNSGNDSGGDSAEPSRDDVASNSSSDDSKEAASPSKSPRQGPRQSAGQSAGKTNGNGRPRKPAVKPDDKGEDLSVSDGADDGNDIELPSSLIN